MIIKIILTKNHKQSLTRIIQELKIIVNIHESDQESDNNTTASINTAIVSNNDQNFENLKSHLWKNDENIAFAHVEHDSTFADISPLICCQELHQITNKPENLILYNKELHLELLNIQTVNTIVIILDDQQTYQEQVAYLRQQENTYRYTLIIIEDVNNEQTTSDQEQVDTHDNQMYLNNSQNESHNLNNRSAMESNQNNNSSANANTSSTSNNRYKPYSSSNGRHNSSYDGVPTVTKASQFQVNDRAREVPERRPRGSKVIVIFKPYIVTNGRTLDAIKHIEANAKVRITYLSYKEVSQKTWEAIYSEKSNEKFFKPMCTQLSQTKKVYIAIFESIVEGEDAIEQVRTVVGHTDPQAAGENTVRRIFGLDKTDNGIHAPVNYTEHVKVSRILFRN